MITIALYSVPVRTISLALYYTLSASNRLRADSGQDRDSQAYADQAQEIGRLRTALISLGQEWTSFQYEIEVRKAQWGWDEHAAEKWQRGVDLSGASWEQR